MRMKMKLLPALLLLSTGTSYAVDFHGYVRGGIFTSTNGEMKSYRIHNLGRFGNEVDGYYDIALEQKLFSDDKGHEFHVRLDAEGNMDMRNNWENVGSDTSTDDDELSSTSNPLAVTQYYVYGKGFIPSLPDATLWVGKRNFQTRELQMMDYKIQGTFGPGAGLENIPMKVGRLSLSWIRNDSTADVRISDEEATKTLNNNNIIDVRYADIPVWGDTKAEFIADYSLINQAAYQKANVANGTNYDSLNSLQTTVFLTTPLEKGFNETAIQYADKGYASNMVNHGYLLNADSDYSSAYGMRVMNYGEEYLTDNIVANHAIVYGYASHLGDGLGYDEAKEFSVAFRPEYIWDKFNKTGFEVSWFNRQEKDDSDTDTYTGEKLTLAHVISVGFSQFVRPEIRFYSTYMKANDEKPFADNKDHQLSVGIQMEAWW